MRRTVPVALLVIGALVMAAALVYGFTLGNGWAEVKELVQFPWFNVSLVDVYVGFALFCGWIWCREHSKVAAVAWIVAVMLLGNLIACIYALIALVRATSPTHFWMGPSAANV